MKKLDQRINNFRPTTDDWYPNYEGNLVKVNAIPLPGGSQWRVCVWGADDFGMEIDFSTRMQALDMYNSLPVIITKQDLLERGFHDA